jgi:hypothetical protein
MEVQIFTGQAGRFPAIRPGTYPGRRDAKTRRCEEKRRTQSWGELGIESIGYENKALKSRPLLLSKT